MILSESSSAARRPTSGFAPAPRPLVSLHAELQLDRRLRKLQRLHIGVGDDELDALHPGRDHAVDRVTAAAADTDHLDLRAAWGSRRDTECEFPRIDSLAPCSPHGYSVYYLQTTSKHRAQLRSQTLILRRPQDARAMGIQAACRWWRQTPAASARRASSTAAPGSRYAPEPAAGFRPHPAGRAAAPPPVMTQPAPNRLQHAALAQVFAQQVEELARARLQNLAEQTLRTMRAACPGWPFNSISACCDTDVTHRVAVEALQRLRLLHRQRAGPQQDRW